MSRTCTQVAEAHPPQWPGWSPVGLMPIFPITGPANSMSTLDKRLASRNGGSFIQQPVRVKLSERSPVIGDTLISALFSSESRPHLPPLRTGTIPRDLE